MLADVDLREPVVQQLHLVFAALLVPLNGDIRNDVGNALRRENAAGLRVEVFEDLDRFLDAWNIGVRRALDRL